MIKFKNKKDEKMFATLHPVLMLIFSDLWVYTYEKHGISLTVTQTVSNKFIDQKLKRKSPAHSEHRAIDIRTLHSGLDAYQLEDILLYINNKQEYKQYQYRSLSGSNRLAYYHIGTAEHIHLAIHSRFAIK